MKLLDPKNDVVFKLLLTRNEHLLRAMLEALLACQVDSLQVLNPEIPGDLGPDKVIVLDVLTELEDGRRVDVEMQIRTTPELVPRLLFYGARNYVEQLARGEAYDALHASVMVAWLGQRLFADLHEYHSIFELRERATGRRLSEHLTLHVLQLPEIRRGQAFENNAPPAELWGQFFLARRRVDFARLAQQNRTMAEAVAALEKVSEDPQAARQARQRDESLKFYKMGLHLSREEGRQEGEQIGVERGREEGERVGIQRGRQEALLLAIERLCAALDVELTASRREALRAPGVDLQAVVDELARSRRLPG